MHLKLSGIEGMDTAWCLLSTPRGHLRPHPRRYFEILMLQSTVARTVRITANHGSIVTLRGTTGRLWSTSVAMYSTALAIDIMTSQGMYSIVVGGSWN